MSYAERLKICHLTTLHFRRLPGDMIDTYKIITGKYDNKAVSTLKLMGLQPLLGPAKERSRCDLPIFFQFKKCVELRNCGTRSPTTFRLRQNCFKSKLDDSGNTRTSI